MSSRRSIIYMASLGVGAAIMIAVLLTGCSQNRQYGSNGQTQPAYTTSANRMPQPAGNTTSLNPDLTSDEFPQMYADMASLNGTDNATG